MQRNHLLDYNLNLSQRYLQLGFDHLQMKQQTEKEIYINIFMVNKCLNH